MKKYLLILLTNIAANIISAQYPCDKELQEQVIPWDKIMAPIGNAKVKTPVIEGRKYSPYQIGLIDLFSDWIKKSYIPIGGLPQEERMALPYGLDPKYIPYGTGLNMKMWAPCHVTGDKTKTRLTRAQPASSNDIGIVTNAIPGMEKADDFTTSSQYYFTMYYDTKGKLVNEEDAQKDAPYVQEIKSKIGNYFVYYTGKIVNVLLMPGKQELPIVQVTKGELLEQAEQALERDIKENRAQPHMRAEVQEKLKKFKEKYKNRWNEPAYIYRSQLSLYAFNSWDDPFEKKINTRYMHPVYRIKPEVYELAKKDKPVWVVVRWPYATEKDRTVQWEIHKAMVNNFNFTYVYDYFFNPEKVAGKTYQPRQPVSAVAAIKSVDQKQNLAQVAKTYPAGVHFMEDFSDAVSGTMPAGWTSKQNNRAFVIETPPGEKGKWLLMDSGADIIPSALKPLPVDFTLEFDLVTTDYTNRAGRTVSLYFNPANGNNNSVAVAITPGNEQNLKIYPSMAYISLNKPGGGARHNMEFSSYSNKQSKAHVKIVKSGTIIKAYINGLQINSDPKYKLDYEKDMRFEANTVFTKLQWQSDWLAQGENKGNVYISNIKITANK